jgi:hypothetical protein
VGRLPFVRTEEGVAPGQAQEMSNETAAIRRAEPMSRDPANAGALAFKRSGDPNMGNFGDATIAELQHDVRATIAKLLYSASGDVPHRAGAGGGSDISMVSHGGGFLARMLSPDVPLAWLSDADLDFYAGEFARTGFRGGLNWFRNVDRNWDLVSAICRRQSDRARPLHGRRRCLGKSPEGCPPLDFLRRCFRTFSAPARPLVPAPKMTDRPILQATSGEACR